MQEIPSAGALLGPARRHAAPVLGLIALKLLLGAWILHLGFTHVSDDDYARTVIAERFAHAPRLDPSGTSWLPFPFWIEGGAMLVAGRSLGVARAVAVVLGAAAVAAPYVAMIAAGVPRTAAALATAIAMALPWNAWLGVATVPEGWTGAVVAAAAIAATSERARPWTSAALLATSLARYEAWPACFAVAAADLARAWRDGRASPSASRDPSRDGAPDPALRPAQTMAPRHGRVAWALIALAGPVAWMLWNAHAHGSALHFVARVTAFRRAAGGAEIPVRDKLLGYPRALADETPEVVVLGLAATAIAAGVVGSGVAREVRRRWAMPGIAAAAILVFLVAGDLGDGAPTHHPARALGPVWWILTGAGVDAAMALLRRAGRWPEDPSGETTPEAAQGGRAARGARRWIAAAALSMGALAWGASLPGRWEAWPGGSDWDRRDAQIARGLALRTRGVTGAVVVPCAFEHFALLAAWGAPERADVRPRTGQPPTAACPAVEEAQPAAVPVPPRLR